MRLERLHIQSFKNLRDVTIRWDHDHLISTVIGANGSGKSNIIEALLHILINTYFGKATAFGFDLSYRTQNRHIQLNNPDGPTQALVDGEPLPIERLKARLREGPAQVFYPECCFVYYSGACQRVKDLIRRYQASFRALIRKEDTDSYTPLFIQSDTEQAESILLGLIAHGHTNLPTQIGITGLTDIRIVLKAPDAFDPELHEPKLWGTTGATRRIVAAFSDAAEIVFQGLNTTERIFRFGDSDSDNQALQYPAGRLAKSGDNLYQAIEHLRSRGMVARIEYQIINADNSGNFTIAQLSEGEKQLLAVIGALTLSTGRHNLILLDEPDTHINPHWSWEYTDLLTQALDARQQSQSTAIIATHDPVMISGLQREQVLLAGGTSDREPFSHPHRDPRGQGVANLPCSSEYFGLPSSLDKHSQSLLDERLRLSIQPQLNDSDKQRLAELSRELQFLEPGMSERDPDYVTFLRQKYANDRGRS